MLRRTAATGQQITVDPVALADRRAKCAACEHYDSERKTRDARSER